MLSENSRHDYTFRLLILGFLASIVVPVQLIDIDKKWDNLPKSLPSVIGFIVAVGLIRETKHEPTEREREISLRYEGLDKREEELNDREVRLQNAEKTAISERDRKQAELNQKIQKANQSEEELKKRLDDINRLIDDRAEVMAEKLNNAYLDRERELEDEYKDKHSELLQWYENQLKKLNNYKHELDKKLIEAKTEFNLEVTKYERKILELELTIKKLNERITQLKAPRLATGGDEIATHECNRVITFLWKHDPPIEVDAEPLATPIETGERETRFWLRLRDPLQFPLLKSEKVLNGIRFEVGKNTNPIIQQEDSTDLVKVTLPWNSKAPRPEEVNRKSVEESLKDVLAIGGNRSWLITGHPGAGKTSSMIYLAQKIGGKEAQRIALNPHQDEKSTYQLYGFIEINELSEILDYFALMETELNKRRGDKTRRFPLVVAVDELGAILEIGDSTEIMAILRQWSVEGRKLGLTVVIGNHSQTTKALDMDAEFRGSFYQLFLVGAARYAIDQPHRNTGLSKAEEQWVRTAAYPALMLANSQYSLVKHPTHGEYKQYRDSGNIPKNLENWESNPVTLADETLTLSSSQVSLLKANQDKPSSVIVELIWGIKPSKSAEYQAKKQLIEQYLTSEC